MIRNGFLYTYNYSYNPPVPDDAPHYKTTAPRVSGWSTPRTLPVGQTPTSPP